MKVQPMIVYYPDTRGVSLSRYGRGNLKLGMDVYTYSRLPGVDNFRYDYPGEGLVSTAGDRINLGTCPGSTEECESICYAKRITGPVRDVYERNSETDDVPPIPEDCRTLRLHVSGDFNTEAYIENWIGRLAARPDVTMWTYTRSWRVAALLPALEKLRAMPNVQLFASLDPSCADTPPAGWRVSWIDRSFDQALASGRPTEDRLLAYYTTLDAAPSRDLMVRAVDGVPAYVCPEEVGRKPDCASCRYCFDGKRGDVVFLEH